MKLKGINPFEQHVEKIVLGIAGAAFVGAMGYQFFVRSNDITVGSSKVPVGDAYRPAADAAKRLKDRVESSNPNVPEIAEVNLTQRKKLGAALLADAAGQSRTSFGAAPGFGASAATAVAVDATFAPLVVPVPATPAVAVHRAAIHPAEAILVPQLASLLPAEQPFDKASVGIEVTFDGRKLKAALENDPDGNGPLISIPLSWWRDGGNNNAPMIEVLALEVERKTIRNADGSTPAKDEVVVLPPMPGRASVLTDWKESVRSAGDVPLELARVMEVADQVQRPEFYSVISGPEWAPASEVQVIDVAAGGGREGILRNQIRTLDQRIKRLERELGIGQGRRPGQGGQPGQTGTGRPNSRDPNQQAPRQPDRGGGGGGKGGIRGNPAQQPDGDSSASEARREGQERNLNNWIKQRTQLQAELEKLTGKKEAAPEPKATDENEPQSFLDNPNVRMWTNDMSATPGAVYAYRARVVVNNPMFGRNLKEEQKSLGENSTAASDWTAWSSPMTVDRDGEFFVVSADASSTLSGRPTATAETFVFYYGYYRNATQSLTPGDQLSVRVGLPDLRFVDIEQLRKDIEAGLEMPELDPLVLPKPKPATGAKPVTPAGNEPEEPALNPLLKASAPKVIPRSIDAVFLGVRETQLGSGKNEAIIRDQDQVVRTLSPEVSRSSELYKRMRASVEAAKELERRQPVQEETPVQRPQDRRPDRDPAPGGGGGGGGGGG